MATSSGTVQGRREMLRKTKTNEPSAAALIRAQGEQIRRETAWEYLQRRCGLRGDAGGDNKGTAEYIPE